MRGVLLVRPPRRVQLVRSYSYRPSEVEAQWQRTWRMRSKKVLGAKEKKYVLSMFPYPSGRLHMGHVRVYAISDCLAHYHRMRGREVLHPMGWDAFGLPAENAAIERQLDPKTWTNQNISHMKHQLNILGFHFDWDKELSTCSPHYYKWTQWLFLKLHEHGLAYKKKALVNWDPLDCTVLANEQVDASGHSWRSGAKVEQKYLEQWFFKITDYCEDLLQGLEDLHWPKKVKTMQENWIGKSKGAYFDFLLEHGLGSVQVFTTRADTIYGVSFLVLSPQHDLLNKIQLPSDVEEKIKSMLSTGSDSKDKEGVCLDVHALHPLSGERIPLFVSNYVISDYGTKAVMAVPAHDDRDREFAEDFHLPMIPVISEEGILINSAQFNGLSAETGKAAVVEAAKQQGFGGEMVQYKLRDWLVSRQRYWGAPIPMVHCGTCGSSPLPIKALPVCLPPSSTMSIRGGLASNLEWKSVQCPKCGDMATRDTDTMDTFVDSSWYFLRFLDPFHVTKPVDVELAEKWMPVDIYVGGVEHAILHLLYARFITHFLHGIGMVPEKEPFKQLLTQGMVQGLTYRSPSSGSYLRPDEVEWKEGCPVSSLSGELLTSSWEKMSKSKHNGVDPEDIVEKHGADAVRLFTLFKAPPHMAIQWDVEAIHGVERWLQRILSLVEQHNDVIGGGLPHRPAPTPISSITKATNHAIEQVSLFALCCVLCNDLSSS
jgi:leucyl-tRNA synthetase